MSDNVGFALGILIILWGVNAAAASVLDYPFLWCWRFYLVPPFVVEYWRVAAFLFTMVGLGYAAFTLQGWLLLQVILVVILIYALPHYYEVLFNIGGSCG